MGVGQLRELRLGLHLLVFISCTYSGLKVGKSTATKSINGHNYGAWFALLAACVALGVMV